MLVVSHAKAQFASSLSRQIYERFPLIIILLYVLETSIKPSSGDKFPSRPSKKITSNIDWLYLTLKLFAVENVCQSSVARVFVYPSPEISIWIFSIRNRPKEVWQPGFVQNPEIREIGFQGWEVLAGHHVSGSLYGERCHANVRSVSDSQ